ncbi:MAG TPA: hypothetical protein ENI62_13500 [Gammaproteobacteria bacterium]|nr:hypothetical protein [Gammaproteobacteria bacterium]
MTGNIQSQESGLIVPGTDPSGVGCGDGNMFRGSLTPQYAPCVNVDRLDSFADNTSVAGHEASGGQTGTPGPVLCGRRRGDRFISMERGTVPAGMVVPGTADDENLAWAVYGKGMCELNRQAAGSYHYFREALAEFRQNKNTTGSYLAWSGVVESLLYEGLDYRSLDCWIQAFDDLEPLSGDVCSEAMLLAKASLLEALLLRSPADCRLPELARELAAGLQVWHGFLQAPVLANRLMQYYVWTGNIVKASALMGIIHHRLMDAGMGSENTLCMQATSAMYCWISGHSTDCFSMLCADLDKAQEDCAVWIYQLYTYGAYAALVKKDFKRLSKFVEQMRLIARDGNRLDEAHYHLLAACSSLLNQNLKEAFELANTAVSLARELGAPLLEGFCQLAVCQVRLAQDGEITQLDRKRIRKQAGEAGSRFLQHLVALLDVQENLRSGKKKHALQQLRSALQFAREQGYLGLPWFSEQWLCGICETAFSAKIEESYISTLIRHNNVLTTSMEFENWPRQLKVYTLGRFSLLRQGKTVRFSGKPQRRPVDLLKVLVAMGARGVSVEYVCGALWPEKEEDAAYHALETTLYRLRKLVGLEQVITIESGELSLDNRHCWVDTWAFERVLSEMETVLKQKNINRKNKNLKKIMDRALNLYHGNFLGEHENDAWSVSLRERLRNKFIRMLLVVGKLREDCEKWEQAIACYQKGLELDDLAEVFYARLITCYGKLGHTAEAMVTYRRCQHILSVVLSIKPSEETQAAMRRLM